MEKQIKNLFFLIACSVLLFSCSKDDSTDLDEMTVIKGTLMSPNGETPISDATIFVPQDPSAFVASNDGDRNLTTYSDGCKTPEVPYIGYTCSKSDGSFELKIPYTEDPTVLVVFQSGAFQFSKEISLDGETMDVGLVPLETNSANIAVVTGYYDRMQDILAKLGFGSVVTDEDDWNYGELILGTETFDLYDGDGSLDYSYPSINELFEDNDGDGQIDLHNYDIVFINCGASETPLSGRPSGAIPDHREFHLQSLGNTTFSQEITDELQTFVEQGGILYCTDWAYDYVEQTFPAMIDFYGSDDVPADEPEISNAAQVGPGGIEVQGEILNDALGAWMAGVSCNENDNCLDSDGSVHITSFLSSWAMMNGAHPGANLETWIEAEVDGETIPMTVSFDAGAGKVIYSSYHTVHSNLSPYWKPQERVLQYLVFE